MSGQQLLLFHNVHKVMKADRLCREKGIVCRVIPVPEHISSECGMCIVVESEDIDLCLAIFKESGIQFELYNEEEL